MSKSGQQAAKADTGGQRAAKSSKPESATAAVAPTRAGKEAPTPTSTSTSKKPDTAKR